MKIGYNKDTNLYPRGNASPLVKVDANGMVDGKLLYPPWWPRFTAAILEGESMSKAAKRVGIDHGTHIRWRKKCPHLQIEIDELREEGRQKRYDEVRANQKAHRNRLVRLGERLDEHPNPVGDITAVRAIEAITRGLDTERKAAERPRGDGVTVAVQNNLPGSDGETGVKAVYTDAQKDEIYRVLSEANGEPAVVEGEIVE